MLIFGTITPPPGITNTNVTGLTQFIGNIVRFIIVLAGLYAFINLLLAGYQFLSGGGDPQKISQAWSKIYQTLLGLIIISASVLLTMVISYILFGDPSFILSPTIYGP